MGNWLQTGGRRDAGQLGRPHEGCRRSVDETIPRARSLPARGVPALPPALPLIYRNGSRFTHPSTHVVDAFVSGRPPELVVGAEKPLERDLALIGSGILALGLAIAVSATPTLGITCDEIRAALTE